jgi:hypothetical protein
MKTLSRHLRSWTLPWWVHRHGDRVLLLERGHFLPVLFGMTHGAKREQPGHGAEHAGWASAAANSTLDLDGRGLSPEQFETAVSSFADT